MDDCAFCEIAAGEREAHLVVETDRTIAFLDRNPATRGHTLVVPTRHTERLFTAEESTTLAVFRTVRSVATAMERALDPAGISLFYTSGELVGHVGHAHVHLLPRYDDDEVHLALARDALDDDDATRLASRIQDTLELNGDRR